MCVFSEAILTVSARRIHFDGRRSQNHLTQRLAMIPKNSNEAPEVEAIFNQWLSRHSDSITVHPNGKERRI